MTRLALAAVSLVALLPGAEPAPPSTDAADAALVLQSIKRFYTWARTHHAEMEALAPRIKDVPGSNRFVLDRSRLDQFSARFLASGLFDPSFEDAVRRYYAKHAARIADMKAAEFAALATHGRGPMMDVEDMEVLFCAQEYEYTSEFVNGFKLTKLAVDGDRARAEATSPYQWKTPFRLVRRGGRWLITGYCVFE
jgi:hypothetical protein